MTAGAYLAVIVLACSASLPCLALWTVWLMRRGAEGQAYSQELVDMKGGPA